MTCVVRWCAVATLLAPASAAAQPPGAANREALKKLDFLAGKWQGPAAVSLGKEMTLKQTEDVQFKLNGTVLLIEGTGRGKLPGKDEEGVVFNALAVVSYDPEAKGYRIKAYTLEGRSADAELTLAENGKGFAWGFKDPQRKIQVRYVMTLTDKGEWHEVGEYSPDGTKWTKFIDMTLTRVKE